MTKSIGKGTRRQVKCWGCEGNHMYKEKPERGDRMKNMHNLQEASIVEDVGMNISRMYVVLYNIQVDHHSNMIEVEGKISFQPISILIDYGARHSYIAPNLVEIFQLNRSKHDRMWMVQLATGTKGKINELVKGFPLDINGLDTCEHLNIILLRSYDFFIRMD